MIDEELCRKAISKWGVDAQVDMVVEECAELIQAIQKSKRHGLTNTADNLVEEMVDVNIMLTQLEVILDTYVKGFRGMWEHHMEAKINRLKGILNEDVSSV